MSNETAKTRSIQAIYVLGATFSILLILLSIPSLIGSYEEWSGSKIYLTWNPQKELVLHIAAAAASYGLGWGIRWVITGETKSVLDRLKR